MNCRILISAVVLALCSCRKEDGSQKLPVTKVVPQSANQTQTSKEDPAAVKTTKLGDEVPEMSELSEGTFTALGLRGAFEQATGIPLPQSVKPAAGKFRVWNEKDYGGKNRSYHSASFTAPPSEMLTLADTIESKWRALHGTNPELTVFRSIVPKEYSIGERKIHQGTICLQLNEPYASYKLIGYNLSFDPVTGFIELTSYRGTEDTPGEREKPESK